MQFAVRAYADTSWWVASKFTADRFHLNAASVFDHFPEIEIVWTPWQRVEVISTIRQLERAKQMERIEASQAIRLLEREVRLGYWPHREFSWTNAIRRAVELANKLGPAMPMRGMDLFHVAIASILKVKAFLTFDAEQRTVAKAAGLKVPELS